MTIKRRLFISNILMIVLPMLLTVVMVLAIATAFSRITDDDEISPGQNRITYADEGRAAKLLRKGKYTLVSDEIEIYQSDTRGYLIILPDEINEHNRFDWFDDSHLLPLVAVLLLLIIVYFTNRTLTRYIFRSIMSPIGILVGGVHEIRDGNLTYQIQYENNDEFSAVCSDFNEMAARLLEMVNQRQKDEKNRRELIAGISHDLRTPLTSIKAYIEGIEKGLPSTPQMQKKYLDTIKNKTNDLEYIINQLFLFSKLDIGEFPFHLEQIDIGDELGKMVAGFADEYRDKGLFVSLAENIRNVFVVIDTVQFQNVIHNVLENSIKYGNKDLNRSEIVCLDLGDYVSISITDNGPGVSETILESLFDVFYRGDSSRKNPNTGSGLGLAISSKIIEGFGGTIRAENARDGGLRIRITLPKHKGEHNNEENINH